MTIRAPSRLTLTEHVRTLEWINSADDIELDLSIVQNVHIWALVALAASNASTANGKRKVLVRHDALSPQSRFAHAVGFDAMVGGSRPYSHSERDRTVRLKQVRRFEEVDSVARGISDLIVPHSDLGDTRQTLFYILVECLRNAIQHSQHEAGAFVGAQLMDKTPEYESRPMIQVAVGDVGIGVKTSLSTTYPELEDTHQALVVAQHPWVSCQFERGSRGGARNAGLGLFFISEMAKRTAGRFLMASRGGSLLLRGDVNYQQHLITQEQAEYSGTLVVFELPVGEVQDYESLIEVIQNLAMERVPTNARVRWLQYEQAPDRHALRVGVKVGAEDTAHAQTLVNDHLLPRIDQGQAIELDFSGVRVCTQSYVHALLFVTLRTAYAKATPIYVSNVSPAVASSLNFLESYALAQ